MLKAILYSFVIAVSIGIAVYGLCNIPLCLETGVKDMAINVGIFITGLVILKNVAV